MLTNFLKTLTSDGVAETQRGPVPAGMLDDPGLMAWLGAARQDAAREFPGGAPPVVDGATGLWAARWLYGACQALVDRTLSEAEVGERLALPAMGQSSKTREAHFTAWLVLRPLAALWRGSRVLADGDVLSRIFEETARHWPLLAPGMELQPPANSAALQRCPSLWRLYVDAVIAAGDVCALADPATAAAVRDSLGTHGPALAPGLAAALNSPTLQVCSTGEGSSHLPSAPPTFPEPTS